MRRTFLRSCLVLTILTAGSAPARAADSAPYQALRDNWTRVRTMLERIVEAFPEAKYDFRPTKEVRTFREILDHMVTDTQIHMGYVEGRPREESDKANKKFVGLKTRAEFLAALKESFDYGDRVMGDLNDQNGGQVISGRRGEKVTRFFAALDAFTDLIDHYGNLVVYLRLNGIVPPETADRQPQSTHQHKPGA